MKRSLQPYLQLLQQRQNLSRDQAAAAVLTIITGQIEPVQVAAFLMGLSVKGETADEVTSLVSVLRKQMTTVPLPQPLLDTCGTGGDEKMTMNISTATALTCAAMGVPVVKHGNTAISSSSGSADVLQALGIPTHLKKPAAQRYFAKHQFVFLFAPLFHPVLKKLALVRQALGVRTIFNLLGPLLNPAQPQYQLVGVADPERAPILGHTLITLGAQRVVIVHSDDGLDEVSVAAATTVFEYSRNGEEKRWRIEPERFFPLADIKVTSATTSAGYLRQLASGHGHGAVIAAVAMNVGLALYLTGQTAEYASGRDLAEQFLRTNKLERYLRSL